MNAKILILFFGVLICFGALEVQVHATDEQTYANQQSYQLGYDDGFEDGLDESGYLPSGDGQYYYDGYHKGFFDAKAILLDFKYKLAQIEVDAYQVGYNEGLAAVKAGQPANPTLKTPPAPDTSGIPSASIEAYTRVYEQRYMKAYADGYADGYDTVDFYITEEGDTFPKVKELPDGGKLIYYEDGRVEVKYGEGSLMWDPADPDKKIETTADGTVITWEKKFSDDSVTMWKTSDGRWCYDFADGGWAQTRSDGSWVRYDATRKVKWQSDGQYWYY